MEQTEIEWFNEIIENIARSKTTIFSETLASALYAFEDSIKYLSDKSVILQSSEGHRVWICFSYGEDHNHNCLVTMLNYAGNTNVIRNEFLRFNDMIAYIEQTFK